ncbi:4'-phosphopantetheinyl transferase family protein [Flavobacterium sp.]|uniref:4'-phosphopantetheinyl transferase family protein n=1 Tax=Flavobacterium sp. TaxID=239 RepID=UPI00375127FD
MPLYKTIQHSKNTKILIWKITESFQELNSQVVLEPSNIIRLNEMKSEMHQRAFLSVRKLLQEINHTDADLFYDEFGKPHLKSIKKPTEFSEISITHSHQFSAIIISNKKVGIDIELQREKIIKIANKFSIEHIDKKVKQNYIKKLTVIWGAKEAIFKIKNEKGISFKDHIQVQPFEIEDNKTTAILNLNSKLENFKIHFQEFENYTLVYAY